MQARFSEEQELLRSSVREFLERECPMAFVREMMDDPRGVTDAFWQQVGELGWIGLAVPEAFGGAGLGLVDQAIVFEEAGRALMPAPLLSSSVIGVHALLLGGSEDQKRTHLPALAAGSLRMALAHPESGGRWDDTGFELRARPQASGFRLGGHKRFAADAHDADVLLVPARTGETAGEDLTLFLVDAGCPGLMIRPVPTVDATRRVADLTFEGVCVDAEKVLGAPGTGEATLSQILDRARVCLAAECCGGAARVLELCVAFAGTREQFGSAIGRFQSIQHRCADMLVWVESARSAVYYAAWSIDRARPDAHASACLAKAYASEAYSRVAGAGIQIHGGLGFTWEQDPQLYFKRAKASELWLGDPAFCRELAARVLIDGATPNA